MPPPSPALLGWIGVANLLLVVLGCFGVLWLHKNVISPLSFRIDAAAVERKEAFQQLSNDLRAETLARTAELLRLEQARAAESARMEMIVKHNSEVTAGAIAQLSRAVEEISRVAAHLEKDNVRIAMEQGRQAERLNYFANEQTRERHE